MPYYCQPYYHAQSNQSGQQTSQQQQQQQQAGYNPMKHSKTDPSLSSYQLAHIMYSNNDPNAVKPGSIDSSKTFGSTRAMNIQWANYQYPQHPHHPQQQPLCYYNPPNSVDSNAGNNNNNNNRLTYRQQFPNSNYVHPYMGPYHMGHAGQMPTSSAASSTSLMHRHQRGRFLTSFSANEPQQQFRESAELSEETILNKEHNEILAKLNFVLALVDSLFELINSLSSPLNMLSESISGIEKSGDINVSFVF